MKTKLLNTAILGGGLNSAVGSAHMNAILLSNKYKVVAGCFSKNHEINLRTGNVYNLEENSVYKNFESLIAKEKDRIDCIIILTPTDQHVAQVIACLNSNIAVICEKSLASSVEEGELIRDTLNINNGFLSVMYNYLGYPIVRELKYLIESGGIGKVLQIQVEMPQEGFSRLINGKPLKPQDWRLHDERIPVISLDLGVHLHMLVSYLTGEMPLKVVSSCQSYGNFNQVIDNVNSIIQYSNNVICNMWYSKVALGKRNGLKISVFGQSGSAEWCQEFPEYISMASNEGHKWTVDRGSDDITIANQSRYTRFKVGHPAGFIEAMANYYDDIADDLLNYIHKNQKNNKSSFGVDEAIEGLKLFAAIEKSNILETWQNI